jgi:SAM-dependent methyltransferase
MADTEELAGVSERYKGSLGQEYSQCQLKSGGMAPEKARRFAPFVKAADTVLDFGCGGGTTLAVLDCAEKVGVEPNPASRNVCAANGITAYASAADVPTGSVDVVISHHALEHCLSPIDVLRSLRRVLRPGGRAVFVLPMEEWRRGPKYRANDINHHLFTWTPQTIGNLFTEAGFEVSSVEVIRLVWPPGAQKMWNHLPERVFDAISRCWSIAVRSPQLRIVVTAPGHSPVGSTE